MIAARKPPLLAREEKKIFTERIDNLIAIQERRIERKKEDKDIK